MAEYLFKELDPVLPREWGAQVDYLAHDWTPWAADKTVVHYGGNAVTGAYDGPARERTVLRIYEQSHLSRGWRGIAYAYAIGMSGTLYVLRGEQASGATSGDYEGDGIPENHEARAVLFIMGGDQIPTPEALDTFRKLYALTPVDQQETVIGHRDVKGTTRCPGPFLLDWVHTEQYKASQTEEEAMIQEALKAQDGAFYERLQALTGTPGGNAAYWGHDYEGSKPSQQEWDTATPTIFAAVVEAATLGGTPGPAGPAGKDATVEVYVDGERVS